MKAIALIPAASNKPHVAPKWAGFACQNSLKIRVLFLAVLLSFNLSACQPAATPLPPEPTPSPLPTQTATPTIIWFPPTSTPTAFPTPVITPTLDVTPAAGTVIFRDDFSDPEYWNLNQTASTSIALGKNNLALALNLPGAYLYTLRNEPLLSNFYLEITASTSLCRAADEYGLLLRVSPALEFYRFSISCASQVRLDKYYQGRASSPQPPLPSGALPPGAPSSARLAVWANEKEMRFYINGELQFSVSDPSLSAGSLGVFVRSAGDTAVTVSFSDLIVRAIEQ